MKHGISRWRAFLDILTMWWYRFTYCPRFGHLYKMDMQDYCLNCGKRRKYRKAGA